MDLLVVLVITNFLRTLFIIVIIYYGIRIFTRYVLPMLLDKGVKNLHQKMQEQQRQNQRSSRPTGEVTIDYGNKSNKTTTQNKGDYVDFEEVE